MRATTTAVVRDLDVSVEDLRLALTGYYVSAGIGPDVIGDAEFEEVLSATLEDLAQIAHVPVGAVVGRRLDNLTWRSEPSEAREH